MIDFQPYQGKEHQPICEVNGESAALLLHGYTGSPAEMKGLAKGLSDGGWSSCVPLLPGFGPDIIHLADNQAEDWLQAAQLEWLKLQEIASQRVLVGFSMGGALAIHLASLDPPEKMVLVAPFSRLPGVWSQLLPLIGPFVKFWKPFRTTDFDDPRVRKNVEEIFPGLPIDNPEVQNILRKEVNLPVKSILEVVKLGRKAYRLAPQINVPTLVIQGVKDVTVEPGQTLKLTNRFQKANVLYRTYPGGHDLLKDSPELLYQITQDILTFIGQPSTGKFLDS